MFFRMFGPSGKSFSSLVIGALICLQVSSAYAVNDYVGRPEVNAYVDSLVAEHDFSRQALEEIFREAEKKDKIIELMSRPAERRLQWHEYRKILVDQPRVCLLYTSPSPRD